MKVQFNRFMNWAKKFPYWWLIPIIAVGAISLGMSSRSPMWMDEYVFYRLSSELPNYNSTPDWFFKDRPSLLALTVDWHGVDREKTFDIVYETPIYTHVPLAPIIVSPLVKGLNFLADKGVIPHIEDQVGMVKGQVGHAETITWILRLIPIGLFMWTLYLIFRLMEKKFGRKYAYMMWIPILVGVLLLQGTLFFYWDVFMMFFFVLTLYIMEVHPNSKWKYVAACALVNTKMFLGVAFLAPIVIKALKDNWKTSWKMILPVFSILPFYFTTVAVTHNWLYVWQHYWAQIPIHNFIYTLNDTAQYLNIIMTLGMPIFAAIVILLILKVRKYPEYMVFAIMGVLYAWGTGLGLTQTATMLYVGALCCPIVFYEWNLLERFKKWLNIGDFEVNS